MLNNTRENLDTLAIFSKAISERGGGENSKVKLPELQRIEQFSIECRKNSFKTKTKVITLTSHKGLKTIRHPIKTRGKYL